jgi:restriction system protein
LTRYWGVRLGEGGKYVENGRKGNYIAIGWDDLPDISWILEDSNEDKVWEQLVNKYKKIYDGSKLSISLNSGQIWNFVKGIQNEDIVLVPDSQKRIVLIGKVKGSYTYLIEPKDGCHYKHRRTVDWLKEVPRDSLTQKLKNSMGSLLTVFNLDHHSEEIEEINGIKIANKVKTEVTGEKLVAVIIGRLLKLSPRDFEIFTRDLLSVIGFEAATSQYVGDKGIDVTGSLNAEVASIILRIQVKRLTSSVGIEEVQRLRGTLSSDEHGAIVTTAKFTRQAQEEAQDSKKKQITLIDADRLVDLVLTHYDQLDKKYKDLLKLQKKEIPLLESFTAIT